MKVDCTPSIVNEIAIEVVLQFQSAMINIEKDFSLPRGMTTKMSDLSSRTK